MLRFDSDYMEGGHPKILERLVETNLEQTPGYGLDDYCAVAREKILSACGCPGGSVHFVVGGTQANTVVIDALLRAWQGVVAADSGHIAVHEAGAIEASGHKVLTVPHEDGKITAAAVEKLLTSFWNDGTHEHMVEPGMVYISHPTEFGTLYTTAELEALRAVCNRYQLPLFLDGARLGYGLCAPGTDVTLKTLSRLCDVFYIGGTKVGALFGEAIVLPRPEVVSHLFTLIKQHGALLAKGRLLGLQYEVLFTDDLYTRIAKNAVDLALNLKQGLLNKGYRIFWDSVTNQQFFILSKGALAQLEGKVSYSVWEPYDESHTVVRFATSWATTRDMVDTLLSLL